MKKSVIIGFTYWCLYCFTSILCEVKEQKWNATTLCGNVSDYVDVWCESEIKL